MGGASKLVSVGDPVNRNEGAEGAFPLPRPLGAYELLEEIGRGGNGVVYKARQGVLNRYCAVKMLLAGRIAGPEERDRLRIEATAAASLDHPNIVGIYEAGLEEGMVYFSMEYVPGQTLTQLVRTTMLPAERVARYVRDIARAIEYAHSKGVLHRDLKPTNVIIDGNDQVQITDFGLTKGVHEADSESEGAGSPNFMAPEQASAAFGQTGVRTDVFGIGAILYFLLTDRPPFRGETLADTLRAVTQTEPRRPREFRPGVPVDLETICLKCLEKRPAKRYATAGEVAEELERFLNDEPIHARPVGAFERRWRWCRRHPALAGFAAATTVLLLTLAVGGPAMALRLRHQRDFTRRNLYAADMAVALQSLQAGGERQARELLEGYRPENQDGLDLRGWEWFHLAHRTRDRSAATVATNGSTPTVFHLLPGGRELLLADFGGGFSRWELAGRRTLWTRRVRTNATSMFALSPDGARAAVVDRLEGSTNTLLRILDSADGRLVAEHPVAGLAIPFALTASGDVWMQAGRELRRHSAADGSVRQRVVLATNATELAAALSPDGRWLAAALDPNQLQVVPADGTGGGRIVRDIHPVGAIGVGAVGLLFSPDSARVATCGKDGSVAVWSVSDGRLVVRLAAHPDLVVAADFTPDGRHLVTGGRDTFVRVWEIPSGRLVSEQPGRHSLIRHVQVLPDGRQFLASADDNSVRLWNLFPEPERDVHTNVPAGSVAVGIVPDGKHYGFARLDGTGGFVEVASGRSFLTNSEGAVQLGGTAAASPDGRTLVARILADGRIQAGSLEKGPDRQWTLQGWSLAPLQQGSQVQVFMDASRDLKRIAVADAVNGIAVMDAADGRILSRFQSPGLIALALAPSEPRIAHLGRVGPPRIRDLRTGKDLEMRTGPGFRQNAVFSPDGRMLLTVGLDGVVHVYDAGTGELVRRLTSRSNGLIVVSASGDGSRVAAGGVDGMINLWDLQTGREIGQLLGHQRPVASVEFLSDGRLFSGSADSVRYWPAPGWMSAGGAAVGSGSGPVR